MGKHLNAIIFGTAIVVASIFLGKAYVDRANPSGKIEVTGLGTKDFTSDLIVWEGRFNVENVNLQQAYSSLEAAKSQIKSYLISKGVPAEGIVFSAVEMNKNTKAIYSEKGVYKGDEFVGYGLHQNVQIESKDVKKIEQISREITELINKGIQLYSEAPRYYYTKLADLKIEMISKATEDARLRAEKIAKNSGGHIKKLTSARMGVFQITGQNSKENYSWGGTFNTRSKHKTASITMKLTYKVD